MILSKCTLWIIDANLLVRVFQVQMILSKCTLWIIDANLLVRVLPGADDTVKMYTVDH